MDCLPCFCDAASWIGKSSRNISVPAGKLPPSDDPLSWPSETVQPDLKEVPSLLKEIFTAVSSSIRESLLPMLISLATGLALVAAYFGGGETTRPGFTAIAHLEHQWGAGFSALSTLISAGIMPMVVQAVLGKAPRPLGPHIAFNICFWTAIGAYVKLQYVLNAWINGEHADTGTVIRKVLCDQFFFSALLTYPFVVVPAFRFRDCGFSCKLFAESLRDRRSLILQYCSMIVTCWCTWVPGCSIVYSFPSDLQTPVFSVIIFFFSVLLSIVSATANKSLDQPSDERTDRV